MRSLLSIILLLTFAQIYFEFSRDTLHQNKSHKIDNTCFEGNDNGNIIDNYFYLLSCHKKGNHKDRKFLDLFVESNIFCHNDTKKQNAFVTIILAGMPRTSVFLDDIIKNFEPTNVSISPILLGILKI